MTATIRYHPADEYFVEVFRGRLETKEFVPILNWLIEEGIDHDFEYVLGIARFNLDTFPHSDHVLLFKLRWGEAFNIVLAEPLSCENNTLERYDEWLRGLGE